MESDYMHPESIVAYGALVPMTVYFDDLDAFGMLHNRHYGLLAERAWAAYWQRQEVSLEEGATLRDDAFIVVKEISITFEAPILRPGEYGVHLWIDRLGRTSLTHGFRVCSADGEQTYARGSRVIVRIDPKTLRPTEWSEAARQLGRQLIRPEQ
ncbi:thioesterase [Planotetraspora thailandica]|uniref:Thioesterase n=1 Tax=Planotetraspora thailandica TaxID=487172 RepID=A0A8J3XTH3_9ACTN|nr:thioesterase family protein [Planotetraspora thailandica]GII54352.1 thioesterase [Planotetraspora thailandica]